MTTHTRFLPIDRRQQMIAHLAQLEPNTARLDWTSIGDSELLEGYNFARSANGLPAIVAPAPDPREREW